jgi:uncharacterized protein
VAVPGRAGIAAFRQFVVKIHSRCNLACDHCYVYEHADQSWRDRPTVMSDATLDLVAARVTEHVRGHGLDTVHVVLHGGEPLLAGPDRIRRLVRSLRAALPGACRLDVGMQTNGLLLDEAWCELLRDEGVRVGISLDGDREGNDRHRRHASGAGSHAEVVAAVELINRPQYREVFAGLLCTIDPRNDPVRTYRALRDLDPPRIDFLLPHATWDNPPARAAGDPTPYAGWLLTIYDTWCADPDRPPVRIFDSIVRLLAGGTSLTESLGADAVEVVVVETDGAIELADSLKTAYDGAPGTGLSIDRNPFDDALHHPGVAARAGGTERLCATCRRCPIVHVCGGGLYAHRYRSGRGFRNPSVYCDDLLALITGIDDRQIGTALPRHLMAAADFDDLAAGRGSAGAMAALRAAQRSLRRMRVVAAISERLAVDRAAAGSAWEALAHVDERDAPAVDTVLAHPYVGVWAAGGPEDVADPVGRRYLAGMALAAGVVAGVPVEVEVDVAGADQLMLPSLGALSLEGTHGTAVSVAVAVDPSGPVVVVDGARHDVGDEETPSWRPLRWVQAPGVRLVLDDLDPYRDRFGRSPRPRLTAGELGHWRRAITAAATYCRGEHPLLADGLAAVVSTVTPLEPSGQGANVSATDRTAHGAIGVALPPDRSDQPAALAMLLLHEAQHVKLGAALDLFELYDPADRSLFRVGWRADPRPAEGALQGAYAHLFVTEFWRRRARLLEGGDAERASATFTVLRDQTRDLIEQLATSRALTALGRRWVEQMRMTSASW